VKLSGNAARLCLEEGGVCRPRLEQLVHLLRVTVKRLISTTGEMSVSICCIKVTLESISVNLSMACIGWLGEHNAPQRLLQEKKWKSLNTLQVVLD
jgi:hypothetical protein